MMSGDPTFDAGPRFVVRRLLGSGGMGVVYEAWDRELDERVALKTLRNADGWWLARFKQEFRSLHDLSHPNLVRFGELFDGPAEPFFSMELVEGTDLLTWIRSGSRPRVFSLTGSTLGVSGEVALRPRADEGPEPYDPERLRAGLGQLATAISVLHEAGKVHRDIKPSNVMMTREGRLVLLDFGLATDVRAAHRATGAEVVGTVEYMAPEQALEGTVDGGADWYSVGVILFEVLTGRLPHTGRTPHEIIVRKHRPLQATPRSLVPETPEDLDALCVALLQPRPEDRPHGREVLARLGGTREEPTAERGDTQSLFVGREEELSTLRAAFDAVNEEPLAVVVEGVSGVGKSRLVDHFLEALATDEPNVLVLAGRCYEREVVPFKAFDGIADSLARYLSSLPASEVEALLPRRPALLSRLFPVFKRVEAIAAAPTVADLPDPQAQRLRMFAALRELLLRLALRRRLVWFVDDLQWTDADSLVLLSELLTHEERLPVLLVATVRPVDDPARRALLTQLSRLAPARRIQLGELPARKALELATRLLPDRDRGTRESVAANASGHPMLLLELARHVDASGEVGSLDEMLRRRIEELEPRARELLEVVAVFGGPVTQEVAAAAAEMSSADQVRTTLELRSAHLVRTDGVRRTDRIVAYHDRVREHVDGHLDDARRRHLHERLAIALERIGAAEREPRALVRHARAAGRPALAASYALTSARQAVASLAFDQAAEFFAEALSLGSFDETALR
ncbi:MAG: protein kinase, partial [Sandaracinaceae bacterium]|nr:protein kinase [Sandaracinaceae bacterium]